MSRPLRIAVDGRGFRPRRTGLEEVATSIYAAAARCGTPHRFCAYLREAGPLPDVSMAARVLGGRGVIGAADFLLRRLPAALREDKPDLVHFPIYPWGTPDGIPFVATVCDLGPILLPELTHPLGGRVFAWAYRRWLPRAAGIVAISRATAADLVERLGIPESRIRVVPCGVSPRFRPVPAGERAEALRRLGLPERYFLCVGTVEPRKNLGLALRVADALWGQGLRIPLVLAGRPGWRSGRFRREAARMRHPEALRVLGWVKEAELPAVYGGAAALLLPSVLEGFGLPVLEAMACGAPVLASTAGAIPEVAGEAAVLLPLAAEDAWVQAARRLAEDEAQRRDRIEAGFERAASFTWERSARALLDYFEELAG